MLEVRGYEPSQVEINPDDLLKSKLFDIETKDGLLKDVQNRPERKVITSDITEDENKRLRTEREKSAEQSLTVSGARLIKAGLSKHFNILAELQSKNTQTFVDLYNALSLSKGGGFEQLTLAENDDELLFELNILKGNHNLQGVKTSIENIIGLL